VVAVPLVAAVMASSDWPRLLLTCLLGYFGYTRCVLLVHDWASTRYRVDNHGVTVRSGLLLNTEQSLAWEQIAAVADSQSVADRVARCWTVTVVGTSESGSPPAVHGLGRREVDRIRRIAQCRVRPATQISASQSEARERESNRSLTPVLRLRDHVIIGVSAGSVLAFVPFVYGMATELGSLLSIEIDPTHWFLGVAERGGAHLATLIVVLATSGTLFGATTSWLRFRRFRVSSAGRDIVFRSAGVSSERRSIPLSSVVGYTVHSTLPMMLFRRAQVRCLSVGAGGAVTRGMFLPLVPIDDAYAIVSQLSTPPIGRRRLAAVRSIPVVVSVVLTAIVVVLAAPIVMLPLLVVLGCALLALVTLNTGAGQAAVSADREWLTLRRGVVTESAWCLRVEEVDAVTWRGGVLTVRYRGRRRSAARIWPCSAFRAARLLRDIESGSSRVVAKQK
jgi:uncharacterized membrane protein YdbT with pleckstrin-like domain